MSIGTRIKTLRVKKGLSQTDLAEVFHISAQAISKWESEASLPDIAQLPAIASYFGITIDGLFDYPVDLEYERIEHMIEEGKMMSNDLFVHCEDFLLNEMKRNPKNHRAISTLADLYHFHACCLNEKSAHFAFEALQLKPDNKIDLSTLSNASNGHINDWNIGCHYKLIEQLKNLIQNHPTNQRTKLYLLDNLIADCRFNEADLILDESDLELSPFYRLWIMEKQVGFDITKSQYQKLADDYCDNWKILMEVANRYAFNCFYEEAIAFYEQAFQASPKPRFTDELACIRFLYKSLGKNDLALEACNRELQLLKDEWNITKGELVDELKEEISRLQANSTK